MNFKSNAEEIKYYTLEMLSDGNEHSRTDIIKYVKERSGRDDFTEGNFSGSFQDLVRKNQMSLIKRGVYCLGTSENSVNNAPTTAESVSNQTLDEQCITVLNNTITELQKAANQVNILTISDEELRSISKIKQSIKDLTTLIKLFAKEDENENNSYNDRT